MVIHDDNEAPVEVPIILKPVLLQQDSSDLQNDLEKLGIGNIPVMELKSHHNSTMKVKRILKKRSLPSSSSTESDKNSVNSINQISAEDLEELKTVYKRCKKVMRKIESKYGHLLDLECVTKNACKGDVQETEEIKCQCIFNKKIVFDEEGQEISMDTELSNHICPQKLMIDNIHKIIPENRNIQIEYHSNDTILSDNLQELRSILQNPEIETTYRNMVINKLKLLKQEHLNELKFNKRAIIEKVKANTDEMLSFNGSNISTLTGYTF